MTKAWHICLFILIVTLTSLHAQPLARPFPFSIAKSGLALPLYGSSDEPITAGARGRLAISDGHFAFPDSSRARFFGTVIIGNGCFPDSVHAISVAKRLRSLGFNAVRFDYFDYSNSNSNSIYKRGTRSNEFDSAQARKLDWFIYQLKVNGIYIHLTLNATRGARIDDGIPVYDSLPFGIQRGVNYFEPTIQEENKTFIANLLDHYNPFTKTKLKDEPAIAWLTLTSSNSLFQMWVNNYLHHSSDGGASRIMSQYHSKRLDTLFSRWLRSKYGTNTATRAAWEIPPADVQNRVPNGTFEDLFSTAWVFTNNTETTQAIVEKSETDKKEGSRSARIVIGRTSGRNGDIQYYNSQIPLVANRLYSIKFWSKSSVVSRNIVMVIANLSQTVPLTNQWQELTYKFRPFVDYATGRLTFQLGGAMGDVYLDDVRVTMENEAGMLPTESTDQFNVARAKYAGGTFSTSIPRMKDNVEFYESLMSNYYSRFSKYISDTLKCNAFLSGGNFVQNLSDVSVMKDYDFTSVVTSWDSRRIVSGQADSVWYINNDGMVMNRNGGQVPVCIRQRFKNKPMVLEQFAEPFPGYHVNEMTSIIAPYMAYQDIDAMYLYYYANENADYTRSQVQRNSYNELSNQPALLSTIPASSTMFRLGLMKPGAKKVTLNHRRWDALYPFAQSSAFWLVGSTDQRIGIFRQVEIDSMNASSQTYRPQDQLPEINRDGGVDTKNMASDTEELMWNADDSLVTVKSPYFFSVNGSLRGKIVNTGPIICERLDTAKMGTVQWIALARDSSQIDIASSSHSIIALSSRAANRGSIWSGDSSIRDGWGTGPVELEAMTVSLSLKSNFDTLRVTALDSLGGKMTAGLYPTKLASGRFRFVLDQTLLPTPWFLVEQWKAKDTTANDIDDFARDKLLGDVFPNPGSSQSVFVSLLGTYDVYSLLVFDNLGRECFQKKGIDLGQCETILLPQLTDGVYRLSLSVNRHRDEISYIVKNSQ